MSTRTRNRDTDPALKDERDLLETEAKVGNVLYFYDPGFKRVRAKEVGMEPYDVAPEDVPERLKHYLKKK